MRIIWLLLPFFLLGAAHAQCTKDTDCKGDRICEKQICVAPTSPSSLLPIPHSPQPTKNNSDAVGQAFQDQLACASNPQPGKALKALRSNGYIGQKPKLAIDGMNIYAVIKPLTVFGFQVLEVTGWEPNGDPTLFWRGPGTAPPLNISAVVDGALSKVKVEVLKGAAKAPAIQAASYTTYSKPAVEITCYGK